MSGVYEIVEGLFKWCEVGIQEVPVAGPFCRCLLRVLNEVEVLEFGVGF